MKKKLSENEQKTKNTNTKISNLEMCVSQLEIQLTDSIKVIFCLINNRINELLINRSNFSLKMNSYANYTTKNAT
jgi:hypothetical protein